MARVLPEISLKIISLFLLNVQTAVVSELAKPSPEHFIQPDTEEQSVTN